jgi:hypothetical protein
MNAHHKLQIRAADISLDELLLSLDDAKERPLFFLYDGQMISGGYHVTEVKAGQFSALDCGANHEAWTEIFVQLWDIDEDDRTHMPAGKFSSIIRKVSEHVRLEGDVRLTFEVSDGVQPLRLYSAARPTLSDSGIKVALTPRSASCKPRDRWLAQEDAKATDVSCGRPETSPCCS